MDSVRKFVLDKFSVSNEDEIISAWGQNAHHTWQHAHDHHITANFTFDGPINADNKDMESQAQTCLLGNLQVEGKLNPKNLDVSKAGIYGINGIRARSSYPFYTVYRTNYIHPAMASGMEEQERLNVAGGGIRGAVFHVNPCTESADVKAPFLGIRYYHYHHPEFVRSMGLVCPANLMNGIFMIPRKVCIQCDQKKFPVWHPEEPDLVESEELADKLLFWYFIPMDHVLAWPFHAPPEYRRQQEWNVLEYRFQVRNTGESKILGFLVCNRTLNRSKTHFMRTFLGKVHISDLRNVDLQMVPALNMVTKDAKTTPPTTGTHNGQAQVRTQIAYYLYDTLTPQQIASLCPTFSPQFPNYSHWIIKQGQN